MLSDKTSGLTFIETIIALFIMCIIVTGLYFILSSTNLAVKKDMQIAEDRLMENQDIQNINSLLDGFGIPFFAEATFLQEDKKLTVSYKINRRKQVFKSYIQDGHIIASVNSTTYTSKSDKYISIKPILVKNCILGFSCTINGSAYPLSFYFQEVSLLTRGSDE
jgi:hypothetical protein